MEKLEVKFGGCTKKGIKSINDDAFAAYLPTSPREQYLKGAIACIADGLSNSNNAHIASQLACESIITDYYSAPEFWSVKKILSTAIHAINNWYVSQPHYQVGSSGTPCPPFATTLSCLVIKSNTAHIFHAGDSRIYHIREGQLEQLTQDHIGAYRGLTTYLAQAVGLQNALGLDYLKVAIQPGDRFLLTTDGVHQNLSQRTLIDLCSNDQASADVTAEKIVLAALDKSTSDNATALLVEAQTLPPIKLSEVYGNYSSLSIPPPSKPGKTIDQYKIIKRLAVDARSHVYLVLNEIDKIQYVLKAPSQEHSDDQEYMEGFALEQWLAGKLSSPFLMKIYPRPAGSQYFYHVCEYLQGQTLRQWMNEKGPVSLTEAQAVLHAMIKSVRTLHRNNIIHRDLKPENFMYDKNGTLKLIDFGTAELGSLKDGLLVPTRQNPAGDIGYIAPEYMVKGFGSTTSDLYSLASIVYELLTGELPYAAVLNNQDNPGQYDYWRYRSLFSTSKPSPYIPYWVDSVLKKALSPQPEHRYQSLSEFEERLKKPDEESLRMPQGLPLINRNPVKFYQFLSLALLIVIIIQFTWPYLK